ncbi:MAG: TonB-dependent receptor, partial [Vicinamibacterales bacterium]
MRRSVPIALGAILFAWAALRPSVATAQETVHLASISGRVTDGSGAAIPGATVTARQVGTNVTATRESDDAGRFRFPYLAVGRWEVTVTLNGFAPARRQLTLAAGSAFDLPIALAVGGVSEHVTVSADATVLEARRTQVAGTIARAELDAVPLDGRNLNDVALLVPGVSPPNVGGGTQLFAETSAVPGAGLSIASQRNLSNSFIVDGLSANDDAAGLGGMVYGVDAVDQLQVVTSGGQAELGRALAGFVNVVTRSGTNTFAGSAYDFVRDDALNARNPLTGTALPMHQSQFGGSLGGPIRHDRTFFFTNVELRRLDQSGVATIDPAALGVINAHLAAVGYAGPPVETGRFDVPVDTTTLLAKIDHHGGDGRQLGARYSLYDVSARNVRGAGGLSAPSASAGLDNRDQAAAVSYVAVLSPRTVLETRGQFTSERLEAPPTDPIGPAVSISGVASFGTLSFSPTGRDNRLWQVVSNLSHQAGAHAVRAGVDVLVNDLTITFPRATRGRYIFSSLDTFLAGRYSNGGFSQNFGATAVSQVNPNVGVYVQDEWQAGRQVTINAGLRYDLQFMDTIHTDTNNVSPRVGAAWTPDAARRWLVRASAGVYYDRVPLRALANALLSAGNTTDVAAIRQLGVNLSPGQTGAPVFPAILPDVVATTTLPSLSTMNRDIQNARSTQAAIEVERQLGARTSVSAAYQHVAGRGLIMSINQNVPSCVAAGGNNGCRPNPDYANNSEYSSAGESHVNALTLSLVQRATAWGQYRVSYTLSKSTNNVGEAFFNGPIDPFDLAKDLGRSDGDQRHRLVVTGAVRTPAGPATTA